MALQYSGASDCDGRGAAWGRQIPVLQSLPSKGKLLALEADLPPCWSLSSQYIFVDAFIPYLWITTDFCNNIQGFSIPFRAADLLLHSRNPNLLLGFDRSHPKKQVTNST